MDKDKCVENTQDKSNLASPVEKIHAINVAEPSLQRANLNQVEEQIIDLDMPMINFTLQSNLF